MRQRSKPGNADTDDLDVLRFGATPELFDQLRAPSTVGPGCGRSATATTSASSCPVSEMAGLLGIRKSAFVVNVEDPAC
jgi:hypothetical protein